MSYRREHRVSRNALLDGIEEGGFQAPYSHDIDEHGNDKEMDALQDRASFLKILTGDIHKEVETQNKMLNRMGNDMDASRGVMSRTMDRFKMVIEKKSSRRMCSLVAGFVAVFLITYYLIRVFRYMHA